MGGGPETRPHAFWWAIFWKTKVQEIIWTDEKTSFESGQHKENVLWVKVTTEFVFPLNLECAFTGKSRILVVLGRFPLKSLSLIFFSNWKWIFFTLFTTFSFGRTVKAELPRPIQSFCVFQNNHGHFLKKRSSPPEMHEV